MFKDFSYIIPYRKSSPDREEALNFKIKYLNELFPDLEIIIVEQDSEPAEHHLKGNFRLIFCMNDELFNRSWGMNCGTMASERKYLVFADNDVFMSHQDYKSFFEAIITEDADVVTPCGITINNETYKKVKNINIVSTDEFRFIEPLNERDRWTYSMMLILFKRESLERIGGWIEDFEGWGAEDNAMDLLIQHYLKLRVLNLQLYHIDHSRSLFDGNQQPKYEANSNLLRQIEQKINANPALFLQKRHTENSLFPIGETDRYRRNHNTYRIAEIARLLSKHGHQRQNKASINIVLAVTTLNRVDYLHEMLCTYLATRDLKYNWQIVIADDNSTDGTAEYLEALVNMLPELRLIRNNRRGVAHQFNTIVKHLSGIAFDCCFKCDDDILFLKAGWEQLYLDAIRKTDSEHLCYYSTEWNVRNNIEEAVTYKNLLIANCKPLDVQGACFTITPSLITKIGYMDAANFAPRGLEHVDFSIRCSRLQPHGDEYVYDAAGSNEYIMLNLKLRKYKSTVPMLEFYEKLNPQQKHELKLKLINDRNRIYIPYNESPKSYNDSYLLELACELIEEKNRKIIQTEKKINSLASHGLIVNNNEWQERYLELKAWYNKEYDELPLWFRRTGQVVKVFQGKRSLKSLLER